MTIAPSGRRVKRAIGRRIGFLILGCRQATRTSSKPHGSGCAITKGPGKCPGLLIVFRSSFRRLALSMIRLSEACPIRSADGSGGLGELLDRDADAGSDRRQRLLGQLERSIGQLA